MYLSYHYPQSSHLPYPDSYTPPLFPSLTHCLSLFITSPMTTLTSLSPFLSSSSPSHHLTHCQIPPFHFTFTFTTSLLPSPPSSLSLWIFFTLPPSLCLSLCSSLNRYTEGTSYELPVCVFLQGNPCLHITKKIHTLTHTYTRTHTHFSRVATANREVEMNVSSSYWQCSRTKSFTDSLFIDRRNANVHF